MKNSLRIGSAIFVLTFVFSSFAVTETKAQGPVTEILNRMGKHYKALQTLQSNILMAKYDSQFKETDLYEGKVWYIPGKGKQKMAVRVEWTKPAVEILLVVSGNYMVYRPRLNQALIGVFEKPKGNQKITEPLSFLYMSKAQLKAYYSVKYLGEERLNDGTPVWHLELTPKTAQKYKTAEFWVGGNGMLRQVKVIENNYDSTTVLLKGMKTNVNLKRVIFTITLPKQTRTIKSGGDERVFITPATKSEKTKETRKKDRITRKSRRQIKRKTR